MKRIAIFPGSFDPFTIGHESIVCRSMHLFDEIIIAVGANSTKSNMFSLDQRTAWISEIFQDCPTIRVESYEGLTIDFCKKKHAQFILRGLRNSTDFEYEQSIAMMNRSMNPEIETLFILSLPEHAAISSTIIREIFRNGGDVTPFVPTFIRFEK
jgi:pantetheine-phosphate adenylyltransferase